MINFKLSLIKRCNILVMSHRFSGVTKNFQLFFLFQTVRHVFLNRSIFQFTVFNTLPFSILDYFIGFFPFFLSFCFVLRIIKISLMAVKENIKYIWFLFQCCVYSEYSCHNIFVYSSQPYFLSFLYIFI